MNKMRWLMEQLSVREECKWAKIKMISILQIEELIEILRNSESRRRRIKTMKLEMKIRMMKMMNNNETKECKKMKMTKMKLMMKMMMIKWDNKTWESLMILRKLSKMLKIGLQRAAKEQTKASKWYFHKNIIAPME